MRIFMFLLLICSGKCFSQKENQMLTSKKGIFIEEKGYQEIGLVDSKGKVLISFDKKKIIDNSTGGFIVYDKIISNGPNYIVGSVSFYDNFGKLLLSDFTRIDILNDGFLRCYRKNLCGIYNVSGQLILPCVFYEIFYHKKGLFKFSTSNTIRGVMTEIISTKLDTITTAVPNVNLNEIDSDVFEGVINVEKQIIGGEDFRIVEYITETEPPLFLVQSNSEFQKYQSSLFALMNAKGKILTEFVFMDLTFQNGKLSGMREQNEIYEDVEMDVNGIILKRTIKK